MENRAFIQRLIMILVGLITAVVAFHLASDPDVKALLMMAAGSLIGGGAFKRPGDVSLTTMASMKRPKAPPLPLFVLCLLFTRCVDGPGVFWPKVVHCAPDPGDLVGTVTQILLKGGDYQSQLEALSRQYLPETVICVVDTLVRDWSGQSAAKNDLREQARQRGLAFLAKTGTTVTRDQQ